MEIFYIKQNDTSPSWATTLQDDSGTAINISGASVRLHLYTQDKSTLVIDAAAVVVDGSAGSVRYDWGTSDTSSSGWFWAEWEVTYSGGTVETFPNNGYDAVKILPELA